MNSLIGIFLSASVHEHPLQPTFCPDLPLGHVKEFAKCQSTCSLGQSLHILCLQERYSTWMQVMV